MSHNVDLEVCAACGKYFDTKDGKPKSQFVVENLSDRGKHKCAECREKEPWGVNSDVNA